MGRKLVIEPVAIISAGDMSGNINSSVVDVTHVDNAGLQVVWSASSPVGSLQVQGTIDGTNFFDLLPSPLSISTATGNVYVQIAQICFASLKVVYTFTSGTGTLNVTLCARSEGA